MVRYAVGPVDEFRPSRPFPRHPFFERVDGSRPVGIDVVNRGFNENTDGSMDGCAGLSRNHDHDHDLETGNKAHVPSVNVLSTLSFDNASL